MYKKLWKKMYVLIETSITETAMVIYKPFYITIIQNDWLATGPYYLT